MEYLREQKLIQLSPPIIKNQGLNHVNVLQISLENNFIVDCFV